MFTVTQDPFPLMTNLENESNVKIQVNLEQGEIDSLQSELSIKTRQVIKMKGVEQRLAQSKLMINKIERKLSSGIEMLTSSRSKLCSEYNVKLDTIEKKINKSIEMLSSLQPKLLNFEKQLTIKGTALQSDNMEEAEKLKSMKDELTETYSETVINSDVKVQATSQSQPHLTSQVVEKTSDKEILGTQFKYLHKLSKVSVYLFTLQLYSKV